MVATPVSLCLTSYAYRRAVLRCAQGLTPTGYTPGDYGFDPLGYSTGTGLATQLPELLQKNMGNMEELQLAELKNGRVAMMAITGYAAAAPVPSLPCEGAAVGRACCEGAVSGCALHDVRYMC